MGKNRKAAKQVVSRADSDDDVAVEVPTSEFLTSDDFQVVHKKRHHSTRKAEQCTTSTLQRSRSNSERLGDADAASKGCHSGFWTVKSHQNLTSDGAADDLDLNGEGVLKHSSGYLSAPEKEGLYSSDDRIQVGALNGGIESSGSGGSSPIEAHAKSGGVSGGLAPNGHLGDSGHLKDSGRKAVLNNGHGMLKVAEEERNEMLRKGGDVGGLDGAEMHTMKSNSQKKKDKKAKKKVGTCLSRNRTESSKVLVSSSSEDFSETVSHNVDDEVEAKKKALERKRVVSSSNEDNVKEDAKDVAKKASADRKRVVSSSNEDNEKEEAKDVAKKASADSRKRPGKKQLAAIHEALRKAKEDEERRRREEETRRKLAEEAERLEQERLRLEQEKKEKKRLREKQKREKMRAEGKLLTKSEKQRRARLEATLEAFRQQGVDVPQIGEKRPRGPRLGNYKPPGNRKRLDSSQSAGGERHKSESLSSQESVSGKESDFLPSSFESKDSWDMNVGVESELHFSCSEESDAVLLGEDSSTAARLKLSVEKANLARLKTDVGPASSSPEEEKKDEVRLRSPVICVLGHVDTGKTKLLDYIRRTHVQDSEAGGITQQIGATMIPRDALREKCGMVRDFSPSEINIPGLLVIDTPGHESFKNLRSRGSSICDIAILVVDIMHGLEPQTLESILLLKADKIPFVVALNKIDRLFGWKGAKGLEDIETLVANQGPATIAEFKKRCQEIVLQFANECLNATLFYENKDPRSYVSMVPVSAITGDGMGNLLILISRLTQSLMHRKLVFSQELQATVLEVKAIPGLGTTIDVILVNGRLAEGDTIVLASHEGPFVTQIRSLLMPQSLKELRVKNPYIEYKSVEGAQGLKITGKDLDKTVAGLPLFVVNHANKVDHLKSRLSDLLEQSVNYIHNSERGVYVQASTLGSLEALLEYLTSSGVPYSGVKIGPVVKRDVSRASVMLEHDVQYAVILAFDVKVERDAQEMADSLGVKIFHANIIYHLLDAFTLYREEMQRKRGQASQHFIRPCILKVLPADDTSDKTYLRVLVEAGNIYEGTPLCVPTKGNLEVGVVTRIDGSEVLVEAAPVGNGCDGAPPPCAHPTKGNHGHPRVLVEAAGNGCDGTTPPSVVREGEDARLEFAVPLEDALGDGDYLVSRLTKQSIEVCKEYYKDELGPEEWQLTYALKKMLHIHV